MQSFHELGVAPRVAEALAARDIQAPFRIQTLVLPDGLAGRDVLAKSPTGSGKTLAFAIPIVQALEASDPLPSALIRKCRLYEYCAPVNVREAVTSIRPSRYATGLLSSPVYAGRSKYALTS